MHFSWNDLLSKAVMLQQEHGTKDLRFYGITIGWLGLGFVVGVERQPTPRAVDLPNEPLCVCGKPISKHQNVVCLHPSASQ